MRNRRRHGRKHIDTWTFNTQGLISEAKIYFVKNCSSHGTESTQFEVDVPRLNKTFEGKELDPLRREIEQELRWRFSITWERKLHVRLLGNRDDLDKIEEVSKRTLDHATGNWEEIEADSYVVGEEVENSLVVKVQAVLCGIDCDGNRIHKTWDSQGIHRDWPEVGEIKGEWLNRQDKLKGVAALVDDTPQNREALNRLFADLARLKEHLHKLMHPDQLALTLAKEAGPLALPAPAPEDKASGKPKSKKKGK